MMDGATVYEMILMIFVIALAFGAMVWLAGKAAETTSRRRNPGCVLLAAVGTVAIALFLLMRYIPEG